MNGRSRRGTIAAPLVVLALGLGVLAMHGLQVGSNSDSASLDMGRRTAASPVAAIAAGTHIDSVDMAVGGHRHELLGCLWLLIGGLLFLVVGARRRRRRGEHNSGATLVAFLGTPQRAPPVSTRLSLVGVSRR